MHVGILQQLIRDGKVPYLIIVHTLVKVIYEIPSDKLKKVIIVDDINVSNYPVH
jgi:hypothetical protein